MRILKGYSSSYILFWINIQITHVNQSPLPLSSSKFTPKLPRYLDSNPKIDAHMYQNVHPIIGGGGQTTGTGVVLRVNNSAQEVIYNTFGYILNNRFYERFSLVIS